MSVRRLAEIQPENFVFSEENLAWAHTIIAKYPPGRQASAIIPLLWRAQEQNNGWLSEPAIRYVADLLGMPHIRGLEVATFYTMFQLAPVGAKAHVQVCGTTPCMLAGSEDLIAVCKRRIAERPHTLSDDGDFSWEEVECLGACVNAPMIQIFKDTYEDLDAERFEALLDAVLDGRPVTPGPSVERQFSAPITGPETLLDINDPTVGKRPVPAIVEGMAAAAHSFAEDALNDGDVDPRTPYESASARWSVTPPSGLTAQKKRSQILGPTADEDDLTRIKGIGPRIAELLNSMGVTRVAQIAVWSEADKARVDAKLKFHGRIDREDWVGQAKTLMRGDRDT